MRGGQARLEAGQPDTRAGRQPGRRVLGAREILLVAMGGAIGSVARYLTGLAFPPPAAGFPWPTFTVNVSGCLVLGFLLVYLLDVWPPRPGLRLFLTTGLLGGYTTFSGYAAGIAHLLDGRAFALADAYALTSLLAGLVAVWSGVTLARRTASLHRANRKAARS
ncbi:MAG TPA: fluoride efflux transporter CrcB [Streptosporangiaceae bacterium]